jgi:hypothetical protein
MKLLFKLFSFCLVVFAVACSTIRNVHEEEPTAIAATQTTQSVLNEDQTINNHPITITPLTSKELQKYAYELGLDPKKDLTVEQVKQIENRRKLRYFERALDSQKERLQYSKVLPWFTSDEEKLEFLSIPSIEGRQVWINKNKIWSRAKNLKDFSDIVDSQDIALGMATDHVKKSWGEPENIEISGNPIYKNERWKYLKQVSTPQGYRQEKRFVYFEGGRVVGWETE